MCQSLAQLGHQVTLILGRKPWRPPTWTRQWQRYFGFDPAFAVRRLWEFPRTGFWFDQHVANQASDERSLVYLRYARALPQLRLKKVPTILELHSQLSPRDMTFVANSLADGHLLGLVTITHSLREHICRDAPLAPFRDRILVASDAVDLSRFPTLSAPQSLDLGRAGYIGSLYAGKGMEVIVKLARHLPKLPIDVYGGNRRDRRKWTPQLAGIPGVRLHGPIAPAEVPLRLREFGIALLPNQPAVQLPNGDDIGEFTSPMKLFEYMAAGRAIIASDLPVLREVLQNERNCLLVPYDCEWAWVEAIRRLQNDASLAARLAAQARQDAETRYSFRSRFESILNRFLTPTQDFQEGAR